MFFIYLFWNRFTIDTQFESVDCVNYVNSTNIAFFLNYCIHLYNCLDPIRLTISDRALHVVLLASVKFVSAPMTFLSSAMYIQQLCNGIQVAPLFARASWAAIVCEALEKVVRHQKSGWDKTHSNTSSRIPTP